MSTNKKDGIITKFNNTLQSNSALKIVVITLAIIASLFIIGFGLKFFDVSGRFFGITYGILFGLIFAFLLHSKISTSGKYGTIGVFGGMGIDGVVAFFVKRSDAESGEVINTINSLSNFSAGIAGDLFSNSPNGVSAISEKLDVFIRLGLWACIITITIALVVGSFINEDETAEDA